MALDFLTFPAVALFLFGTFLVIVALSLLLLAFSRRIPIKVSSLVGMLLSLSAAVVLTGLLAYLVDHADSLAVGRDNSLAMPHPYLMLLIMAVSMTAMTFLMVAVWFLKRVR